MSTRKLLILIFTIPLLFSCGKRFKGETVEYKDAEGNIYTDAILQQIYSYGNERNSKELVKYFTNEYPEYRKAAVLAFASVQDSSVVSLISGLLNDPNEDVKIAAAYSLGQIGSSKAEPLLVLAYSQEKSPLVRRYILEAIGKCGTDEGLNFIASLNIKAVDSPELLGQAWALVRFANRNIVSEQSTQKVFMLLSDPEIPDGVKSIISNYFIRLRNTNLTKYTNDLIKAYSDGGYIYMRINIVKALANVNSEKAFDLLTNIIETQDEDYRVIITAIRSLENFPYDDSKYLVKKMLFSDNEHISYTASLFFLHKGNSDEATEYFETANRMKSWWARSNMLRAALKYTPDKYTIADNIISGIKACQNNYEKAAYIGALSEYPAAYKFVESLAFSEQEPVVRTAAMETLANMRRNKDFEKYAIEQKNQTDDDMKADFARIFKKAIQSQDVALMAIAADVLSDTSLHYRNVYSNTYFLTQAIENCQLPRDYEAYISLIKASEYINGKSYKRPKLKLSKPDWKFIRSIAPEQKAIIKTNKGDITIRLNVNEAPVTVANFIKLAKDGYYDGKYIHRVVPVFVIQAGCNRGDGWGTTNDIIASEFPLEYYEEGSVGMASAGKDTESAQWFITYIPTPWLDGKYTLFASMIDGFEVMNKITVGDKIISVEIK